MWVSNDKCEYSISFGILLQKDALLNVQVKKSQEFKYDF